MIAKREQVIGSLWNTARKIHPHLRIFACFHAETRGLVHSHIVVTEIDSSQRNELCLELLKRGVLSCCHLHKFALQEELHSWKGGQFLHDRFTGGNRLHPEKQAKTRDPGKQSQTTEGISSVWYAQNGIPPWRLFHESVDLTGCLCC